MYTFVLYQTRIQIRHFNLTAGYRQLGCPVRSHTNLYCNDCHQKAERCQYFGPSILCGAFQRGSHNRGYFSVRLFPKCYMWTQSRVVPFGAWFLWPRWVTYDVTFFPSVCPFALSSFFLPCDHTFGKISHSCRWPDTPHQIIAARESRSSRSHTNAGHCLSLRSSTAVLGLHR